MGELECAIYSHHYSFGVCLSHVAAAQLYMYNIVLLECVSNCKHVVIVNYVM